VINCYFCNLSFDVQDMIRIGEFLGTGIWSCKKCYGELRTKPIPTLRLKESK